MEQKKTYKTLENTSDHRYVQAYASREAGVKLRKYLRDSCCCEAVVTPD